METSDLKTTGFNLDVEEDGFNSDRPKGFDIATPDGRRYRTFPTGARQWICNGITYSSLVDLKQAICSNGLPEDEVGTATAVERDTWQHVDPAAMLVFILQVPGVLPLLNPAFLVEVERSLDLGAGFLLSEEDVPDAVEWTDRIDSDRAMRQWSKYAQK